MWQQSWDHLPGGCLSILERAFDSVRLDRELARLFTPLDFFAFPCSSTFDDTPRLRLFLGAGIDGSSILTREAPAVFFAGRVVAIS